MKKIWLIGLMAMVFLAGCIYYVKDPYGQPGYEEEYYEDSAPAGDLDVGYFYDQLSPYGYWVNSRAHGYVWVPHDVDYGWRPYTRGRWMWTDYGWTWVSQYRWGWAPFHYGRWGWDDGYGWFWVPGTVWGPAWVTWRRGSSYFGWAPLPPGVRFVAGVGITSLNFRLHDRYWIFVDGRNFYSSSVYRHILPWERNARIVRYTTPRTRIVVRDRMVINDGLDFDIARRASRSTISKVRLEDARRAGPTRVGSGGVEIYRPRVSENRSARPRSEVPGSEVRERVSSSKIRKTESEAREPVEQRQDREARLLKESQDREARELQKQAESKKRRAASTGDKRKAEQEYEAEAVRLKKRHTDEKSKLQERHKTERSKTSKSKVSKTRVKKKKK